MANINAPFGLRAVRLLGGGTPGRLSYGYTIGVNTAGTLASDIGYGQPIVRTGAGKDITPATDGGTITGVFYGCKYRRADGSIVYAKNWVASTVTFNNEGAQACVVDDPNTVFQIQMSGGFTAANSGQFAGLVVGTSSSLGISSSAANSSDISGTADNFKILGLANIPGNAYGNYAIVEVLLGTPEYAGNPKAT